MTSTIAALTAFVETPLDALLSGQTDRDPAAAALEVFRMAAARVPAYRRFLARHGIDPGAIRSPGDFVRLPTPTKDDYLRVEPLPALCIDGRIAPCDTIAHSSGSTGEPVFFPRSPAHELAVAVRFEQVLRDAFRAHERSTLAIVCFPLGTWVGGLFTTACLRHVAAKGYPLMVATPGTNRPEIIRVMKQLAPLFDQVVLFGYPPFLKDVIDTSSDVDWRAHDLRLVLAGEVFSEAWRSLVAERAGIADVAHGTAALYGTADAGVLGCETPLTIAMRRFVAERPALAHALFGSRRLPTLVQYDPFDRYFEADGSELLFTASGGIPLVRYRIGDTGGLLPYAATLARLRAEGFEPPAGRELPFCFVFGRAHHAVSFYGANVFVETIAHGLVDASVRISVTGKLVLAVDEDAAGDSQLHVDVELAPGVAPDAHLEKAVGAAVLAAILEQSGEFGAYVPMVRQQPAIRLWRYADPDCFPAGIKHRWVR
jgi:phenylacetate-CoA ligase